jgi:uncharacterized surface protein with fasciclin (FAS1) repeats
MAGCGDTPDQTPAPSTPSAKSEVGPEQPAEQPTDIVDTAVAAEDFNTLVAAIEANVTATDIECSNGVIHVIDAVVLPKSE